MNALSLRTKVIGCNFGIFVLALFLGRFGLPALERALRPMDFSFALMGLLTGGLALAFFCGNWSLASIFHLAKCLREAAKKGKPIYKMAIRSIEETEGEMLNAINILFERWHKEALRMFEAGRQKNIANINENTVLQRLTEILNRISAGINSLKTEVREQNLIREELRKEEGALKEIKGMLARLGESEKNEIKILEVIESKLHSEEGRRAEPRVRVSVKSAVAERSDKEMMFDYRKPAGAFG